MAEFKTNAVRILQAKKIPFEAHSYPVDENIDGISVAKKIGLPFERVYKTLVTKGKSGNYFVFVIRVDGELDLKKAAKSVGEKSVEMIHVKDINKITGYIRGGCSPVGMKKQFVTVIDKQAERLESFAVSAGKIGYQIEISPHILAEVIGAGFEDILLDGGISESADSALGY